MISRSKKKFYFFSPLFSFPFQPQPTYSHQVSHLEDHGRQINYERRLLCTTSFHLGQDVLAIARHDLSSSATSSATSTPSASSTTTKRKAASRTMEFGTFLGSTDGGVSVLCPISSSSHVRLLALQNVMTHLLPHPCGMNPISYRSSSYHQSSGWINSVRDVRYENSFFFSLSITLYYFFFNIFVVERVVSYSSSGLLEIILESPTAQPCFQ